MRLFPQHMHILPMSRNVQGTGERFRILAEALYDGNKSDLARALDMKPGSFTKYLRGARRPGASILERLTRLGINVNWFLTGEGQMMVKEPQPSPPGGLLTDPGMSMSTSDPQHDGDQYHPIPLVEVRVGSKGEMHLDEIGHPEWLSGSYIRHRYQVEPHRLRAFRMACSLMANTILPGDRVRTAILDLDRSAQDITLNHPYVLLGPSGVFAARIQRAGETSPYVLTFDNPEVEDEEVSVQDWNEDVRPIARILEVIRPL